MRERVVCTLCKGVAVCVETRRNKKGWRSRMQCTKCGATATLVTVYQRDFEVKK